MGRPSTSSAWLYSSSAYSFTLSASPASCAARSTSNTACFAFTSSTRSDLMPSPPSGICAMMRSISSDTGPAAVMQAGASVRRDDTATFVTESPSASFIAANRASLSFVVSSASFFSSSEAKSRSPDATFFSSNGSGASSPSAAGAPYVIIDWKQNSSTSFVHSSTS